MSAMPEIPAEIPRRRRIALPASIILNLFLVAVIGGHIWHAHRRSDKVGTPLARAISRAEEVLPPRDAAALGAVMRRDEAHYDLTAQQLGNAREELNRQLVAEPFDPEATRRALQGLETAWAHFLNDFSGTLIDGLSQVSPEGRRKLVMETPLALHSKPAKPP